MSDNSIYTTRIFDAEAVTAGASVLSDAIDLNHRRIGGNFSIQVELTGDGTGKFEWVGSNNGTDYIKPNAASDIVTAHVKTSGPGADGKHIYGFNPSLVRFLKIQVTETGAADAIAVTATLAIQ